MAWDKLKPLAGQPVPAPRPVVRSPEPKRELLNSKGKQVGGDWITPETERGMRGAGRRIRDIV